ncbi:MAG: hypothetical protein AB1545_13500 [Thermodesulfobacteriota bacterium]
MQEKNPSECQGRYHFFLPAQLQQVKPVTPAEGGPPFSLQEKPQKNSMVQAKNKDYTYPKSMHPPSSYFLIEEGHEK